MRSEPERACPKPRTPSDVAWLDHLLRCPCDLHRRVTIDRAAAQITCSFEQCRLGRPVFPIIDDQPVLVDFAESVLDEATTIDQGAPSLVTRSIGWQRSLSRLVFGDKPMARRNAVRFLELAKARTQEPVVLVVGGGSIGDGAEALYEDPGIRLVAFDVYRSSQTHFVADAHSVPLAAGTIDGVWIQAVLEHVLSPEKVVAEICRVLKPGGLVYAETPFMQQVHEGAYDFTRFTVTGQRWLFRGFELIESGVERGPFTVLLWSIRYALTGLTRSRSIATLVCVLLFWLRYFDRLVPGPYASDGASDLYFMGSKVDRVLSPREVVRSYAGAQRHQRGYSAATRRPSSGRCSGTQ